MSSSESESEEETSFKRKIVFKKSKSLKHKLETPAEAVTSTAAISASKPQSTKQTVEDSNPISDMDAYTEAQHQYEYTQWKEREIARLRRDRQVRLDREG